MDHHRRACWLDHGKTDEGVGALVGGFLSRLVGFGGIGQHGLIISIVIAVMGAVLLTWVMRLFTGNRSANL